MTRFVTACFETFASILSGSSSLPQLTSRSISIFNFQILFQAPSPGQSLLIKSERITGVELEPNLKSGGGNRDRTCDLLNANQMLSQLSYAPTIGVDWVSFTFRIFVKLFLEKNFKSADFNRCGAKSTATCLSSRQYSCFLLRKKAARAKDAWALAEGQDHRRRCADDR